jgi:hypothetical protein
VFGPTPFGLADEGEGCVEEAAGRPSREGREEVAGGPNRGGTSHALSGGEAAVGRPSRQQLSPCRREEEKEQEAPAGGGSGGRRGEGGSGWRRPIRSRSGRDESGARAARPDLRQS